VFQDGVGTTHLETQTVAVLRFATTTFYGLFAFSALTLLVEQQPACKKTEWWGAGVVICLEQRADCLNMVQLMPLHPKTPSSVASVWFYLSGTVLPGLSWKRGR